MQLHFPAEGGQGSEQLYGMPAVTGSLLSDCQDCNFPGVVDSINEGAGTGRIKFLRKYKLPGSTAGKCLPQSQGEEKLCLRVVSGEK